MIHSKASRAPQDEGRSTSKKKELLYKNQILPSQLMCKDMGSGEKSSSWDFGEQCGEKKKERGRRAQLSRPRLSALFGGRAAGRLVISHI